MKGRNLSMVLVLALSLSLWPVQAQAEGPVRGLCPHHREHTADCGWQEGGLCAHEHGEDCYRLLENCVHRHTPDCYPEEGEELTEDYATPSEAKVRRPTECSHSCSEESGCVTRKLDCRHEHDGECGYQPGSEGGEGSPCAYDCRICPIEKLIAALPDVEDVTEDNGDEARAQLDKVLALFSELTGEEQGQIDLSRCYELQEALDNANAPMMAKVSINYQEASWDGGKMIYENKTANCTPVESSAGAVTWTAGWYAAGGDLTIDQPITVTGAVNLILTDGCTLNAEQGIVVTTGNSLTIYAQSEDGGTLNATGTTDSDGNASAGIGGGVSTFDSGRITIHGGVINATGGGAAYLFGGAGIGGGTSRSQNGGNSGAVTIYGGTVTAASGAGNVAGAGIGGGSSDIGGNGGNGNNITIYGGSVMAESCGTDRGGAGIGGGGGDNGGSGNNIAIYGGIVQATGGECSAGIGGGMGGDAAGNTYKSGDGIITISGGTVTAIGGQYAAGIGGGGGYQFQYTSPGSSVPITFAIIGGNGTVTISGGIVDASSPTNVYWQGYEGAPMGNGGNTTGIGSVNKNNAIVFENGVGTVCGDVAFDGRYQVPGGYSLHIPTGASLSGRGVLTGGGTFTTENLTEDMVSVPTGLYYNGEDRTEEIAGKVALSGGTTICGQTFTVSGWTVEVAKSNDLTYIATYMKDNTKNFTKTITLQKSGTQFAGGVKTYNGSTETSNFTIDDTITVIATPKAAGTAPQKAGRLRGGVTRPGAGQMAVFVGEKQLCEPVNAGADGTYTMTVSASDVLEKGNVEPNSGAIFLTVRFVENDNMAGAEATAEVTITSGASGDNSGGNPGGNGGSESGGNNSGGNNSGNNNNGNNNNGGNNNGNNNNGGNNSGSNNSAGQGSSSSGGSGDSSGGTPQTLEKPEAARPEIPAVSETSPVTPDKNGNAVVSDSAVTSAVSQAKQEAKKNGNTQNSVAVIIPVTSTPEQNSFHVAVMAQTLDTLVKEDVRRFEIRIEDNVCVSMTPDTLKWLDAVTDGRDILLRAEKVPLTNLSREARTAIGARPVYDLKLFCVSEGAEIPITSLDGHSITVRMEYTPAQTEVTGCLYAVYVDNEGKVEWLTISSYDPDQKAQVFEAGHFSIYGIGYQTPVLPVAGIKDYPGADHIHFAVSRKLLTATDSNQFLPDSPMTRGMFAAMLGRLAGIDTADYQSRAFTDAPAQSPYAPYLEWAAQKGIMSGTGTGAFSPDAPITREEMAVFFKNYADKMGYTLPHSQEPVTFADSSQISAQAKDAVNAMQRAGILAGKDNGRLDPKGTATCAEGAAMLRRFVEITVDPQTANGWTENDSGTRFYRRDGKPVTGWLKEEENWYWLDNGGTPFINGWKQIDSKWYYFYSDGKMAVNIVIDGYSLGPDGARRKANA